MSKEKSKKNKIKFDIAAGLVVFFVALPLCLGISLASTSYAAADGVEAFGGIVFPGLIAGIIGGIIVGTVSGSRFGVSGPAAGLITIVATAIVGFGGFENGGFEKFALAVAIAGVFQIILGFAKAGFIAYFVPSSVIKGMLAGIGITIIIKEIPHFFGYDKNVEGDMNFIQRDGHNSFSELYYMLDDMHIGASIVGFLSIGILLLWGAKRIKSHKILSMIPGPLLAIFASVAVAAIFLGIPDLKIGIEHLVLVPTPTSLEEVKAQFYIADFSSWNDPKVYIVAFTIAIVASLETLLCVEATDKMDPFKGRTPLNRELKAQGLGNLFSGLLGGLPITQVIVRSSANINAGADSKKSAIIHGLFLLVFIIAIPDLLNMIPRATLAAVLILIGYKLASPVSIKAVIKSGWTQYVPFAIVVIVMLLTDLLIGVATGLVVGLIVILYHSARNSYMKDPNEKDPNVIRLVLAEHTTFLNKVTLLKIFDEVEAGKKVIIDLSRSVKIDYDVSEAIIDFKAGAIDREIEVGIIDEHKLLEVVHTAH